MVNRIETHEYASGYVMRKVIFSTVHDETIPPAERFQGAHPIGEITMQIDNPAGLELFRRQNAKFFIEFTEAE